jgi:hypothetical protein
MRISESLVKQSDIELAVDMQAKYDELLLSRDQKIGQGNLLTCVPSLRQRSPNWRQSDYDLHCVRAKAKEAGPGRNRTRFSGVPWLCLMLCCRGWFKLLLAYLR